MTTLTIPIEPECRPFDGDEVLAFYDGPIMFWLPWEQGRLLAIALPDEAGAHPFLVVEVSEENACALLTNRKTVRKVFMECPRAWLMADYGRAGALLLEPLVSIPDEWLPGDVMLYLEMPK